MRPFFHINHRFCPSSHPCWQGYIHQIIVLLLLLGTWTSHGQGRLPDIPKPPQQRALKALYINSYAPTYRWADEVARGVRAAFDPEADVTLFVEYLDGKRYGKSLFEQHAEIFRTKYSDRKIDVIITSDNLALDFLLEYPNLFSEEIPVVFCGIANTEDYELSDRFYGFREEEFHRETFDLALDLWPNLQTLYFIYDHTESSLVNIRMIRALESEYANRVKFEYLLNTDWDETLKAVEDFDLNGVIASTDVYSRNALDPVSVYNILKEITTVSKIPVLDGREGALGSGVVGGVFTNGFTHGNAAGKLAISFLKDPDFQPGMKVFPDSGWYAFDHEVLAKFDVDMDQLPPNSIIINGPEGLLQYLKYILILLAFIVVEGVVITLLLRNIELRKKAEHDILDKLELLKKKNTELETANATIKEMFGKQEELTESLRKSVDQLENAREEAEKSNRLKTEFLNNLTHEIRTPMNGIIGFAEMLMREDVTTENITNFSGIIQKSSNQLLKIIDDILEISNLDTNQSEYSEEEFDLNELFDELVSEHQPTSEKVTLKVKKGLSGSKSLIFSDPHKLKKILGNLMDNAVKFTHQGSITVGYSLSGEELSFFVKDTGVGIDERNKEIVFDRFRQENPDIANNYGGLGLGLSIARENVRLLGGEISIESTKGKGSSFFFDFPYKPAQRVAVSENVKVEVNLDHKKYKVLVADDEYMNFEFIKMLLQLEKNNEFTVLHARNGQEAVDLCDSNDDINLVLMDVKMPIMNGHEATKKIKRQHPDLPVIVQTAYSTENDRQLAISHGCDDFLVKPLGADHLMKVMYHHLNR